MVPTNEPVHNPTRQKIHDKYITKSTLVGWQSRSGLRSQLPVWLLFQLSCSLIEYSLYRATDWLIGTMNATDPATRSAHSFF